MGRLFGAAVVALLCGVVMAEDYYQTLGECQSSLMPPLLNPSNCPLEHSLKHTDTPHCGVGVDRKASEDDIKSKYRKLARKFHPDKVQGEKEKEKAQKRFMKITEAYEVLPPSIVHS